MKKDTKNKLKHEILGITMCGLSLILFLSLITNKMGIIGSISNSILYGFFGLGAFPFVIILLSLSFYVIFEKLYISKVKIWSFVFLFLGCLGIISFIYLNNINFQINITDFYRIGLEKKGGGLIGNTLAIIVFKVLGIYGSYIFYILTLFISLISIFDISVKNIFLDLHKLTINILCKAKELKKKKKVHKDQPAELVSAQNEINTQIQIENTTSNNMDNDHKQRSNKEEIKLSEFQYTNDEYIFPPINLLAKNNTQNQKKHHLQDNINKLEQTLQLFGINAKVVNVSQGPSITRYEIQPAPGTKVSKILNLVDDIALNLATNGIRMEAPIPGKSAIGIEVPNKFIKPVYIREIIESDEFQNADTELIFALGKDVSGKNIIVNIEDMPHLLIAGTTGSGKSVCLNSIIVSLLYKVSPLKARFILIDTKMVEFNPYKNIPHLLVPVVTDAKKAAYALNWAVEEMNRRYKVFSELGIRDINKYNIECAKNSQSPMPKIIIIVDELADLMMISPKEVEESICRLCQMARASGIHLIIATQRPSTDIITGLIKANIPSRISFAVASQVDSRTILDMAGAEKLLGKGDMLYFPKGELKPIRVQGTYISEKEVEEVVNFIKNKNSTLNSTNISDIEISTDNSALNIKSDTNTDDFLIKEAIKILLEHKTISTSLLQRKLKIGYVRAARIIDILEQEKIISPQLNNKTRQLIASKEIIDRILHS